MNRLGMFLKKLRIEHGEVLFDMAQRLHVTSAFLSAVENDRRSAPLAWIDTITNEYDLSEPRRQELSAAIGESIKQIRMDVGTVSANRKACALAFARSFDDLSEDDIQSLMGLLEKRRT